MTHKALIAGLMFGGLLLSALPFSRTAAQAYTVTDLGLLSGDPRSEALTVSGAYGINAKNEVTGTSSVSVSLGDLPPAHAFVYDNSKMMDLGIPPKFTTSCGIAINDNEQVIVCVFHKYSPDENPRDFGPNGVGSTHTFLGGFDALVDLTPGDKGDCVGKSLNNKGQVVGHLEQVANGPRQAFIYNKDETVIALNTFLPKNSKWKLQEANGINDRGDIVGSGSYNGKNCAFLYHNGQVINLNHLLQKHVGWVLEKATSINNKGDIVAIGTRTASVHGFGPFHAFLYSRGATIDLGELPKYPDTVDAHLNNVGQVVGVATNPKTNQDCAFVYTNGKIKNLNDCIVHGSHWNLTRAYAINDMGAIVGEGTVNDKDRGYLLTPK